jgi:fatty-acyl-CoA synthase
MHGLMMDQPLLISDLIRHADRHHASTEIVSKTVDGSVHRYTYRQAHARARRLANALQKLGVRMHDRVATLAWNGFRHYEIYYAAAGSGAVIHTINPRLFPEQIAYIANHAEDRIVFYDTTFSPLVEKLRTQVKAKFIPLADEYEALLETISSGRASTRRPRPACATPRAPPATRRARSTRTARP